MNELPAPPEGLSLPPALLDALRTAYEHPKRVYHTFDHALEVARTVLELDRSAGFAHPKEAYVAALFHDAIYDASRRDNEARSAELARTMLARFHVAGVDPERVARLVERTAEHGRLAPAAVDRDEALFLDADLAILAAPADAFDRYERGVAAEYAGAVASFVYRAGRRRFLERLLASPRLFLSDDAHARWDAAARANLRRTLGRTDS